MAIQFSYFQMDLKVELSTGGRDHYCLSVCKELEFSVVKALSNLSLKILIGSTELPAFCRDRDRPRRDWY